MYQIFSLRLPAEWCGRFSSTQLHEWVAEWLSQPQSLPPDPGPGPCRFSIRLTGLELSKLRKVTGRKSISGVVRSIAAIHVSVPVPLTGWRKYVKRIVEVFFVLLIVWGQFHGALGQSEEDS